MAGRRSDFGVRLERALTALSEDVPTAQTALPNKGVAGADLDASADVARQKAEADKLAKAKAGQRPAPGQPAQGQQSQQDQVKKDAEATKQRQQGTQLGTSMANMDRTIVQTQAKIQGGAVKPSDLGKLNQLLTAKKAVQDQFMRNYGVNPTA